MNEMEGKVALITGAASGIGRACAQRLSAAGAAVVIADVDLNGLGETGELIEEAGGTVASTRCDVSSDAEVAALVAFAVKAFGRLDAAHNNAGVMGLQRKLTDYPEADWDRIFAINTKSVFLCLRHELPVMLAQGGGSIVNTASAAAVKGGAADAVYTASKHAVAGLTKSAALEVARRKVRVNAVCPGVISTKMTDAVRDTDPAQYEANAKLMPIGRYGQPDEIAEAVLWLCSDASSLVTGHLLVVDGGWTVR
jgi:NAD(P)-dependent dehydrogenase (short-subunit alcohol dehydrogenase family)